MRTNPLAFIPKLKAMQNRFVVRTYKEPGKRDKLTSEGPKAIENLIEFLEEQEPVDALEWDDNLSRAARDHINDMKHEGAVGEKGLDGSNHTDRIERYTKVEVIASES